MIEAVFISDLHLHPNRKDIELLFAQFIAWARHVAVKKIYILGDFFHAWAGDDALDEWSRGIARQLFELSQQGVTLFYLHGNRDFLLGKQFAALANLTFLKDSSLIYLDEQPVLLSHGDRYCTKDVSHQYFRLLTRNTLFTKLFLCLPLSYRLKLVNKIRQKSQENTYKTTEIMDVVDASIIKNMKKYKVFSLIHGHTHKPGVTSYSAQGQSLQRYVLSDWDAIPSVLCYDKAMGIYFNQSWCKG